MEKIDKDDVRKYCFLYHMLPENSKMVLYSAGQVGKMVYEAQMELKMYDIIAWVDKNYEICVQQGYDVENPEILTDSEADCIVVTVEKKEANDFILQNIVSNGWDKRRMILGPMNDF